MLSKISNVAAFDCLLCKKSSDGAVLLGGLVLGKCLSCRWAGGGVAIFEQWAMFFE